MTIMELENGIYEIIIREKANIIATLENDAYRRLFVPMGTITADIYCDIITAVGAYIAGNGYKELVHDELADKYVNQDIKIGQYIQLILMPYDITISKKVIDEINEYYYNNRKGLVNSYNEVR